MKNSFLLSVATLSLGFVAFPVAVAVAQDGNAVPLIEREKLFGNPQKSGAALSPNGKWIA